MIYPTVCKTTVAALMALPVERRVDVLVVVGEAADLPSPDMLCGYCVEGGGFPERVFLRQFCDRPVSRIVSLASPGWLSPEYLLHLPRGVRLFVPGNTPLEVGGRESLLAILN